MDYGEQGLKDTLKVLNNNHIEYIGAEIKKEKISKSYTIGTKENKIGIYNCCDIEFSVASENNPGAYGIDFFNIWEEIKDLKEKNDYVIIIYHGGKEHYRYPSPNLQKMCRKMIDYGADLIVCQHSHCIGCKEKTIIYGQGNFIFDGQDNEYWNTSLLIDINLSDEFKINYIPICKTSYGTRLANKKEKEKNLEEFENRSKEIKIDKFVEKNYKKFSEAYFDSYLQTCHGDNLLYRIINKVFFHRITKKLYSKRSITALLNIIECDAHRELFIQSLKCNIKEGK